MRGRHVEVLITLVAVAWGAAAPAAAAIVAAAESGGLVRLYDTDTKALLETIDMAAVNPGGTVTGMDFNPDNGDLYVTYSGTGLSHYVSVMSKAGGSWTLVDSFTPPTHSGSAPEAYDVEVISATEVYVTNRWRWNYNCQVSLYDGATATTALTTGSTSGVRGLALGTGDDLWIGPGFPWNNPDDGTKDAMMWRYDRSAGTSAAWDLQPYVGDTARGTAWWDDKLYVVLTDLNNAWIRFFSTVDGSYVGEWNLKSDYLWDRLRLTDLEFDEAGNAYILAAYQGHVVFRDALTGTYSKFADGLTNPVAVAYYKPQAQPGPSTEEIPEPATLLALGIAAMPALWRRASRRSHNG